MTNMQREGLPSGLPGATDSFGKSLRLKGRRWFPLQLLALFTALPSLAGCAKHINIDGVMIDFDVFQKTTDKTTAFRALIQAPEWSPYFFRADAVRDVGELEDGTLLVRIRDTRGMDKFFIVTLKQVDNQWQLDGDPVFKSIF